MDLKLGQLIGDDVLFNFEQILSNLGIFNLSARCLKNYLS